ncbi:hypothetical protein GCM10009850_051500 [Nonomuraea monospora]|uniref:Histidine kinase/HSP90-like ATPase domain-containing protein n=1 Tax=Nonomuraea monospora TaxID=568818 RepID=A0ABN3CJT6_9ACTN
MNGMTWWGDFPGECAQVAQVRRLAGALLQDSRVRDDAILCLVELSNNAILHTRSAGGVFTVGIWSAEAMARVAVKDAGGWDEPVLRSASRGQLAEGGRGLAIVVALAGRVGVAGGEEGRVVWADLWCEGVGAEADAAWWEEVPPLSAGCGGCWASSGRPSRTIYSAVCTKGEVRHG